jgi:SPP1 family predicted phage head-tail adaptor
MKILRRSIQVIDIGEMRDIVILKAPTIMVGTRGNENLTYPESGWISAYALVKPGGNERSLQEANLTYDNIITVYIRWNSSLQSNWKVRYDGFDYTIHKSSNVDAKKRFIELLCYAKTG